MREGTIPPNLTDLVQRISKRGAPNNIDLKDTWFTPDLNEYPIETQSHEPSVAPGNNINMLTLSHYGPYVQ